MCNFEEEVEIAEKEINELNNQKEVAEKEDVAEISLTQEEKDREKNDLENRIRKLKKEIERDNSKELIIGRTKGNEEIPNQIDTSANELQELEEDKEIAIEEEEELIPGYLKEGSPLCDKEMEIPRRNERPMLKRRGEAESWDCAMDLSGEFLDKIC